MVPTQPNGRLFQMGKLLSLLCLSKPIVEKYQELYGQKLVAVHTTALYGHKGISQYDWTFTFFIHLIFSDYIIQGISFTHVSKIIKYT